MITGSADDVFIIGAYGGVALATLSLVFWVIWESRAVKRRLAALEKAGIRRRSAGTSA